MCKYITAASWMCYKSVTPTTSISLSLLLLTLPLLPETEEKRIYSETKKDPVGDPERKKKKNQKGGSGVNQEVCPP